MNNFSFNHEKGDSMEEDDLWAASSGSEFCLK